MAAARTAKVLLELVELAPAEQLEVMLDPVVLLELLDAFGKSAADPADSGKKSAADPADSGKKSAADPADSGKKSAADPADSGKTSREATKAALESGTLPGELLRDLLKEHGAEAVWARVPPDRQRVAKVAPPPPSLGILDRLQSKERSRAERYVALAGLTSMVWSAMWMAGAFPEWGRGPGLGTTIASVLGGAACFATITRPRSAGMVGGFVAGLCNVGAAWLWVRHYPDVHVGRLAVIAIVLVPLMTGLFFAWLFERLLAPGAAPRGF